MAERNDGLLPGSVDIWGETLERLSPDEQISAVVEVVRVLLLPMYAEKRPGDRRPERAVEAAELFLARRTDDARRHAAAVAKACKRARRDTLGSEHRIVEAARALAVAVTRTRDAAIHAELCEALARTEEHLLYRYMVQGVCGRESEVRGRITDMLSDRPSG